MSLRILLLPMNTIYDSFNIDKNILSLYLLDLFIQKKNTQLLYACLLQVHKYKHMYFSPLILLYGYI